MRSRECLLGELCTTAIDAPSDSIDAPSDSPQTQHMIAPHGHLKVSVGAGDASHVDIVAPWIVGVIALNQTHRRQA